MNTTLSASKTAKAIQILSWLLPPFRLAKAAAVTIAGANAALQKIEITASISRVIAPWIVTNDETKDELVSVGVTPVECIQK
jgi:hypothetical protein